MNTLKLSAQPLSNRPFLGLGAQADAYIFNETNRICGVNEEALALIARRIHSLRPGIIRMFVELAWFGYPDQESAEPSAEYRAFLRQLKLLQEAGSLVNLVLFSPGPRASADLAPAVRFMVEKLHHLRLCEGCDHIRWLTLWNEPDHAFGHGSALGKRLFTGDSPSTWGEYVRLNRFALGLLEEKGLADAVTLVVADTVWGAPMRRERMELALEAFGELPVAYSFHNYSNEREIRNAANPDFYYHGIEEEVRGFRQLLGPDRELVLWEFNTAGVQGFGSHFAGVGPRGEERIGSVEGAADLAEKVLGSLAAGVDGTCVWCLHDMKYGANMASCLMEFGLWRYQWRNWYPRPLYHYYGALMDAFRPGVKVHAVENAPEGIKAAGALTDTHEGVALLNTTASPKEVAHAFAPEARLTRIAPDRLPAVSDLPLHSTAAPERLGDGARAPLVLEPLELLLVSTEKAGANRP